MTEYAYLIALIPLFSFVMIVFFLRWKESLSAGWSILSILTSFVMSVIVFIETLGRHGEPYEWRIYLTEFVGLPNFEIGILVDSFTSVMLLVVTIVAACVHIYSTGYMKGDPRYSRFFSYLSLFCFSMLGLVLANNFFMIFIFWELVGLTSYLLIGFWFEKKSAADAGKKAFLTTRIGDLGFLVGLMMVGAFAGTFNYNEVFGIAASGQISTPVLVTMGIFIFCGAVGKSAQFPLHVWLPDAMEGPTPVSALIHAATMVAAGVYMVARTMNLYVEAPDAAMIVAIIGLITSFIAASIGLVQNDIKRVLAYSTVSQLGYMIMALGLFGWDYGTGHHESAGYVAGTLHLMTHAFFKALLFLGAGSVIHAVHTNDIQDMGGLIGKMKITGTTFIIASLSIAGIFPLSGFWSKDEIVASTVGHPIFNIVTLLIAFMTAFYMFRLVFLTFFGKPRDQHRFDHAHESPRSMSWPLAFLGFLAVVAGWWAIPWLPRELHYGSFVFFHVAHHAHAHWDIMIISTAVALSGIGLAYLMYYRGVISPVRMGERFAFLYKVLYNKYYFDELYDFTIIRPLLWFARFMWSFDAVIIDGLVNGAAWLTLLWSDFKMWIDKWIVDGAVNGSGWVVRQGSNLLRHIQTGGVQSYVLFITAGIVLITFARFSNSLLEGSWHGWALLMFVGLMAVRLFARMINARVQTPRKKSEK